MSTKPYYVLLTGGKNNAGDFLIKYRAIKLLKAIRQDRDFIDVDAWRERDQELLTLMNGAKAIILTGGPALRPNMSAIYAALGNIDDIHVPILAMGIGWRSFPGDWVQTHEYNFKAASLKLLDRIESSGYRSSVRDYHSLNVLLAKGYKSFEMTGCPALFDLSYIKEAYPRTQSINRIAFSLGVSFADLDVHERNFKRMIVSLKEHYVAKEFDVAFHHSLDKTLFQGAYDKHARFYEKHIQFSNWLKNEGISFTDISGSAENLMAYYDQADIHIGYRVHAHIYMSSVNKPSILIAEDGRGKALHHVINGLILDSEYYSQKLSDQMPRYLYKLLRKVGLLNEAKGINENIVQDLIHNLRYEEMSNFARIKRSRLQIDSLFGQMTEFIQQLP